MSWRIRGHDGHEFDPVDYVRWIEGFWAQEDAQERGRAAMAERCAAAGIPLANSWYHRRQAERARMEREWKFTPSEWPIEPGYVPLPADPDALALVLRDPLPLEPLPIISAGDVAGDHIPALRRLLFPEEP